MDAEVMHKGLDREGSMRLQMNALLIVREDRVLLLDPGASEELPEKVIGGYDLQVDCSLEDQLATQFGLDVKDVSDVIFTHLHFDHCSGAFVKKEGQFHRKFPRARYHVLEEHFSYALEPEEIEADAFYMKQLMGTGELHWLEGWHENWMEFRIFHGHTRAMAVPLIKEGGKSLCYLTDLVPLRSFLDVAMSSGYDRDPVLARLEKEAFLKDLDPGMELLFYHES